MNVIDLINENSAYVMIGITAFSLILLILVIVIMIKQKNIRSL